MYFKRLEIFGFKSFADKTVLNFEPGITAIVGPNGCGKSNIFDAIRWVLGEQSVKELRGRSMEDVIFNGTLQRPPLGFAEVSLTFSNDPRVLPVDYDEVTITRRLFRSGESEYLLNKTTVRLKDILELLMGTGIGAEAYSLVQQGKVDLVVSARPEDRRIIIDEAAGITKYKAKKKEALNKLKDTENNLLRVNDIITEVKRQISSIERQAKKARRYKDYFDRLKLLEVKVGVFQLRENKAACDQLQEKIAVLQKNKDLVLDEIQQLKEMIAQETEKVSEIEQRISEIHAEDMRLENAIELENRQITFNRERIENLRRSDSRLGEEYEQLQARKRSQQEKITQLQQELEALHFAIDEKAKHLEEKQQCLEVISGEIHKAKTTIKHHEEKILQLTSQQVGLRNELTEIMKEFQGTLARKRRLDIEKEKVSAEKEEVDNKLQSVCDDIESCCAKIDDLKDDREEKTRHVNELKARMALITETIDELEKKKLSLISQRDFIEKLRVQYEGMPDPVVEGRLLTVDPPQETNKGIIGKVKEVYEVEPLRLEAIRQNFPQFHVDRLFEVVCETKFIELDPQLITVKIDELGQQINVQREEKERLAQQIETQENVIRSIQEAIHDQEKVLSIYEAQKNDILGESSKLLQELELVESEIREARQILTAVKEKENHLTTQLDANEQELQSLQLEIKEKQDWIAVKRQQREETTVTIAQLETEIQSDKEKEVRERENLKIFEDNLCHIEDKIHKIETDQAENNQKIEGLEKEIEEIKRKISDVLERRRQLEDVISRYESEKDEKARYQISLQHKLEEKEKEINTLQEEMHGYQMEEQEISFKEKSIKDRLLQTYKINLDTILQQKKEDEISTALALYDEAFAQQSAVLHSRVENIRPEDVEGEINLEESLQEIETLQRKCESFGAVNLVAIDEFEELRDRFEFLTKQQADLITAKESLHRTIAKINRATRQMFLDTFTKVSEEFRIYFRMLFGGGEAYLELVEPENVLESGIEINVKPPGKKQQRISLLSGGEKTLAAIALIFAVFKVNPSPFCILDEIDAALDESNVGRFGYLLKDFAKIAQFIVITHNKKTIANASVMYGITMQQSGVSKIVSVKLSDEEEKKVKHEEPVGV